MKNIVIGRFVPGNSFLYRIDPRTKIISLFTLMISAFFIRDLLHLIIMLALILLLLIFGRISIKRVYLGLRPLMFILMFTFSFQIFFNRQGQLLFKQTLNYSIITILIAVLIIVIWYITKRFVRLKFLYFIAMVISVFTIFIVIETGHVFATGAIEIYEQGLQMAFFIMLRLMIIVTLSTILTMTTKPTDLNLGLESVLKPLKILRINSEEMAMIIAISLRYIPTLLDEANKIMLAQASRGVDFSEGKLKDKIMQVISLLVPMFIISFKRSDELANAMEARSFVPGQVRTRLHVLHWRTADTLCLTITIMFFFSVIAVRWVL